MKYGVCLLGMVATLILGVTVLAQEEATGRGMARPPTTITTVKVARVPVQTVKTEVPIPQPVHKDTPEFRGEGFFFQRCSTCHLGEWRKGGQIKAYGPVLKGTLKDPSREQAVRTLIRNGTLNMPGFQNTFTPSQFDDLIAYIKTL